METWRPIRGFEGHYEVSDAGRIRSLDRVVSYKDGRSGKYVGVLMKGTFDANGYVVVGLSKGARRHVHRLIAEAFLEPQETRRTVNHKNGNKADNRLDNLEWASYAENNRHARATGLQNQHADNCNLTKYSSQIVDAMKKVYERYKPSYRDLSDMFGMSAYHAGEIIRGESRKKG